MSLLSNLQILDSLIASGDSEEFREPVDWVGLGLTDYLDVIKRPMDLGTVRKQLEQGVYSTPHECAADVRLIWDNCRLYNPGGVPRRLHKVSVGFVFSCACYEYYVGVLVLSWTTCF